MKNTPKGHMHRRISGMAQFVTVDIWRIRPEDLPLGKSFLIRQLRVIVPRDYRFQRTQVLSAGIVAYLLYAPFHRSGSRHSLWNFKGFWL